MVSTLINLLILTLLTNVILSAGTNRAPLRFIDECLGNIECPSSQFCNSTFSFSTSECEGRICPTTPRRCVPRTGPDIICAVGTDQCRPGLYCRFDFDSDGVNPFCAPQIPRGGACDLSATKPCRDGLVCDRFRQVCDDMTTGFQGDPCEFDRNCMQEAGFYCKNDPTGAGDGVCSRKRRAGAFCDRAADNFECLGFCATRERDGVCVTRREIGETCSDDSHCQIVRTIFDSREKDMLCNHGRCATDVSLLRRPGLPCNRKRDLCDARRVLKCGRFRGRNVCLQRARLGEVCTRGSPLSSCDRRASQGVPLECRRRRFPTSERPYGVDVCSRVTEIVKRGDICNRVEYAKCEKGTVCAVAPGVETFVSFRGFDTQLAYCMKPVPVGSDCSNKFDTVCENGSFCVNNACKVASSAPQVPVTFSGLQVQCDTQKCAPGLVCVTEFGEKICSIPTMMVKRGRKCFETATMKKKCQDGSFCTRGRRRRDLKRCRPVAEVGQLCEEDDGCKGRLKCRPETNSSLGRGKTCYDPRKSLGQGASCKPNGRRGQKACVVSKDGFQETKCLAKGKGFACQVEAPLFGFCSLRKNLGCSKGQKCSTKSVCEPLM